MAVINVSRGGLLLESDVRLRPGSGICLNVVVDGVTHRIDGQVLHVDARIVANRVVYRAGIAFDEEVLALDPAASPGPVDPQRSPVPAPPIEVTATRADGRDLEAEVADLRAAREVEHRQRDEQARTIATLREALQSGERLRQEILEASAAERDRWQREQQELAERVREAEEQAAAMVQDMRSARDAARRSAREHADALAALETRVRERDQQLAALRAEQAALLESVTRQLEEHEQREAARQAQQGRLTGQLAATEAWCADQQHLLYRVRQQMTAMFALLDGADPAANRPALADPLTTIRPRLVAPAGATIHVLPEKTGT